MSFFTTQRLLKKVSSATLQQALSQFVSYNEVFCDRVSDFMSEAVVPFWVTSYSLEVFPEVSLSKK